MLRVCILTISFAWAATAQDGARSGSQLLEEANAHYRALRSEDAARLYREYLTDHPSRADVRVYLGAALFNSGQFDAALKEARHAIATDAKFAKAYVLAARVYAERQQWTKAQELFAQASQIDPSDRDAWYFSGRTAYEAGHFSQAIKAFLRAGSDTRVHENLGLTYEALGRFSEADVAYKQAVQLANGAYRPYLTYGVFLFKQNRPADSLLMLQEAVRLDPNAADARFELARVLYQSERFSEALSVLPPVVPPDQCRVHNLRGRIMMRVTQPDKAQREFEAFGACVSKGVEIQR